MTAKHHCSNCEGVDPSTCLMNPERADEAKRQRAQLLEAMAGVSEERWCAGWMSGLDRRLHAEGGIWETIGRSTGWPVGDYENWTWFPWGEAAEIYARERKVQR